MARPAEFDRKTALRAALHLFWRQGYGATNLNQLLDSMELSRSSLYGAFGDKRALYIEALEYFASSTLAYFSPLNTLSDPKELVAEYFRLSFSQPPERLACGCMMVNTVLELSGVDDELAALAAQKIRELESLLEKGFLRGQAEGYLSNSLSANTLAKLVLNLSHGLRVSARIMNKNEIEEVVQTALDFIQSDSHKKTNK